MCSQQKETSELVLSSGFNFQKAIDLPEKIFYRTFKIFTPDSSCSSPKSKGSCIFDNPGLDYKPANREDPRDAWGKKNMTSSGNFYSNQETSDHPKKAPLEGSTQMANLGYRTFNVPTNPQKYSTQAPPPPKMTNFFNLHSPSKIPHKKTNSCSENKLASIRGLSQTLFSQNLITNAKNFGRKKNCSTEPPPEPIGQYELMNNKIDTKNLVQANENFLGQLSKDQQFNQKDYVELENGFLQNAEKRWADGTYEKFLVENMNPVYYLREYFRENFDDKSRGIGVQMQRC